MVLQSSGSISFNDIQTEFGGTNPISLNEYYLNGLYTTGTGATGIPTSGAISLNNFYGKSKTVAPVVNDSAITIMGANLVLRHDGKNIDGTNNSTLIVGNVISSWYNSGSNTGLTTTATNAFRPIYTLNGAVFSNGKLLISNINLNNYLTMNIFVVWKKTASSSLLKWLWSQDNGGYDRTLIINGDTRLYVGRGDGGAATPFYSFPINTTVVVNCEYNSSGLTGNFYVNNTSITSFSSLPASGTTNTFFGSINTGTTYNGPTGSATVDGIIYEIIIINRLLTSTERTNIYTTLNTKWMI